MYQVHFYALNSQTERKERAVHGHLMEGGNRILWKLEGVFFGGGCCSGLVFAFNQHGPGSPCWIWSKTWMDLGEYYT